MNRTPEQITAAAQAIDHARAQGLPDDLLLVMLAARDAWQHDAPWPDTASLTAVVMHPASRLVDEVLVHVIRRHLTAQF
jgi:hypothetical protein